MKNYTKPQCKIYIFPEVEMLAHSWNPGKGHRPEDGKPINPGKGHNKVNISTPDEPWNEDLWNYDN